MSKQDDNNDDSNQIKKMIQVGIKLLELVTTLGNSCSDCEKCAEYKKVSEKATTLFAKIIAMQAEDNRIMEQMLSEAVEAIEKIYEQNNKPEILH